MIKDIYADEQEKIILIPDRLFYERNDTKEWLVWERFGLNISRFPLELIVGIYQHPTKGLFIGWRDYSARLICDNQEVSSGRYKRIIEFLKEKTGLEIDTDLNSFRNKTKPI